MTDTTTRSINFDLTQYPTLHAASLSSAYVRFVRGPAGAAKTSWAFVELLRQAAAQAPAADGVRYTKFLVGRNTYQVLVSNTMESARKTLGPLFEARASIPPTITGKFALPDGTKVDTVFEFLSLEGEEAMNRLLGGEWTAAFIDELSEVPERVVHAIIRRIGRYPSNQLGTPSWVGVLGTTNGPIENHWLHQWELGENAELLSEIAAEMAKHTPNAPPRPFLHVFAQPPALLRPTNPNGKWTPNPAAENVQNLPGGYGYYFAMLSDPDPAKITAYVEGDYAPLKRGKLVYPQFRRALHVVPRESIRIPAGTPIGLSFDFGRTPVCTIYVRHATGRLLIVDELMGEDMAVETLMREKVVPRLKRDWRASKIEWATGDPAGESGGQGLESSPYEVLWEMGVPIENPGTNLVLPRVNAVATMLTRLDSMGFPLLQVTDNCTFIIEGFMRSYIYEQVARGDPDAVRDTPTKSHINWVSDLQDAIQYAALLNSGDYLTQKKAVHNLPKLAKRWA